MTKEEKIIKRKERAFRRKSKRVEKDNERLSVSRSFDKGGISWGRKKLAGGVFSCDMGYYDCELRMFCNGDC